MDFDATKHGHGVGRLTYLSPEERPPRPQDHDAFQFHPGFEPDAYAEMERIVDTAGEIQTRAVADVIGRTDVVIVVRRRADDDWFVSVRERFADAGYELTEEAPGP